MNGSRLAALVAGACLLIALVSLAAAAFLIHSTVGWFAIGVEAVFMMVASNRARKEFEEEEKRKVKP